MNGSARRFVRHAMVYGIAGVVGPAASIALVPLYTRNLSAAEYGSMELIERLGTIILIFLMMGGLTSAAITYYCQAQSPRARREAATASICLQLGLLGVSALISLVAAAPLSRVVGLEDVSLTRLGLIAVLSTIVPHVPLALTRAREQSMYYLSALLAINGIRVLFTAVALVSLHKGLPGVFVVWIVTMGITGLIMCGAELVRGGFRLSTQTLLGMVWFVLPFLPLAMCMLLVTCADRFFLARYASLADVGRYALGCKLAGIATLLGFQPLYQAWTARKMYEVFASTCAATAVGRMCSRILTCYLTVALLLTIIGGELVSLLASDEYAGAGVVVAPILLADFFRLSSMLMDGPLLVHRKTYLKAWIAAPSALIMIAALTLMVPRWGVLGAAYANVVGFAMLAAVKLRVAQAVFVVKYEYRRLLTMIALFFVLSVIATQAEATAYGIVVAATVTVCWTAGLWFAGGLDEEDKQLIRQVVNRYSRLACVKL